MRKPEENSRGLLGDAGEAGGVSRRDDRCDPSRRFETRGEDFVFVGSFAGVKQHCVALVLNLCLNGEGRRWGSCEGLGGHGIALHGVK
ncbi:hypothetical protein Bca52824_062404 [Brassica carinata]|uniref:Uncharacterized protein n=1 Tax=Brassica carinata TaxID=52824 RepID=A0A8X7QHY7_BRACI|nr:hypothetical protein Bca52824_062404 [Brassica carinata]